MLGSFIRSGNFKTHHTFDKTFILAFAALTWIISIWGFAPGLQQVVGDKTSSGIMYLHIFIFFSWLVVFSLQVSLVSLKRTDLHKIIGPFGVFLAVLMFFSAISLAIQKNKFNFDSGHQEEFLFMIVPFVAITIFLSLISFAALFRKNPAIHRRLILLAMIELMVAPLARKFGPIIGPIVQDGITSFVLTIYGADYVLILVAMGYDLATRGKVHRIYWVAVPLIVAAHFLMSVIHSSSYWPTVAQAIIGR